MLKRLSQVMLGTIGFVIAIPVIMFPPPGDGNWLFWVLLLGKMGLGLLILLKSLDLYRRAAFPPNSPALRDPVVAWFCEQDARLYKASKIAWVFAQLMLIFVPVFMLGFGLTILLRPAYVTLRHPQPGLGTFVVEGRRTLHFVLATVKGLFFLTLSTLMGSMAALITLAVMFYWC
ncbi:hypothetical protein IV102_01710 [bacterium]|nr:hypothetical protein [bacterium]